ncbi:MAG: metallopeptidase TldD-related protein, partial [Geobacteraceae bacterium]
GQMDIIADLAYPLPVVTIVEMLGFPAEDFPRIKQWSDDLAAALSLNPSPKQQTRSNQAWNEIRGYFEQVVARMQRTPGNSLLSRLLEAENEPDGLNRDQIFTNCVLLLSAGHETTTNLIGNGMLALLRNRDQWDLLVRQPDLIESAVDELLRYDKELGDFVFEVTEGYLIENGRIAEPVRGATLTGNGPDVLKKIVMVGSDLGFGIGTCGKDGQGVPVADAQPTLLIAEITVGGAA